MNSLPEPLTPADCDLRDYQYMPLDVVRLRDSDIAAISSGDEFRSAVLLWCASWHQVPAASLPDDDIVLSQLAGFGRVVKEWKKIREGALRGWIKCADGRLYHPVVAEKANESWQTKLTYHYNKLVDRTRKENKKREELKLPQIEILSIDDWKSIGMPSGFPDNFQRKSNGIPTENKDDSTGNPPENALNIREPKVRDNLNPSGSVEDISHTSTSTDDPPQTEHPKTGSFPMYAEWLVSKTFASLCKTSGITESLLTNDILGEFKTYWLTQPQTERTQAEWEHALIKSIKSARMRSGKSPPNSKTNRDEGRTMAARSIGFGVDNTQQRIEKEVNGEKLE